MRKRRTLGFLAAVCAVAAAWFIALPVASQARPRAFDPELLRTGDLIRYRALQRDDFRADGPPAEVGVTHGELGAATCVYLTTDPRTSIRTATESPIGSGSGVVRAQVENLSFIAYMDRRCSWWNPRSMGLPDDYILQHEQIHFALFELAGQRLNARAEDLMNEMSMVSASHEQAIAELGRRIDVEMHRMLDEVMARSNDFDRETSRTYRRDRQHWWWETVMRELDRFGSQ